MCRSRKMLKNAYLDAKIGVDTEENEPSKVLFFNFNPAQGFNFHICTPSDWSPTQRHALALRTSNCESELRKVSVKQIIVERYSLNRID